MKTTTSCLVALLVPAIAIAQPDPQPQPVCPMECNCFSLSASQIAGFGLQDNFALPAEPVEFFASTIAVDLTTCGALLLSFDEIPGENGIPANGWFAAEAVDFSFACDARLEVHARATTGAGSTGTGDDQISFLQTGGGCPVPFAWSALLRDLPEANGTWLPGQDATFCLDLDALPVDGGTFNVLQAIYNARLEVVVADNTGVDSIIISLCRYADAVQPRDWGTVKQLYR